MKIKAIILLAVAGTLLGSFFVCGVYALRKKQRRENIKVDESLISSLDSFEKASFVYKILSDYWDKDETSRGRNIVKEIMLEKASTSEDWRKVYALTSGWNPDVKQKAKEKLQELGVLLD